MKTEDLYGLPRPVVLTPGHTSELLGGHGKKNPGFTLGDYKSVDQGDESKSCSSKSVLMMLT